MPRLQLHDLEVVSVFFRLIRVAPRPEYSTAQRLLKRKGAAAYCSEEGAKKNRQGCEGVSSRTSRTWITSYVTEKGYVKYCAEKVERDSSGNHARYRACEDVHEV